MYSRARAYTCYARGRSERKEKNTSTYTTRVSPSLRVWGRNEASNVRAMRPDNRRKRNGGTREEERAEYRLRNSASSRFYRFTWTRTMGERSLLINAHSFLLFFLSFPFFFIPLDTFSARKNTSSHHIDHDITACAKEAAKLSARKNIYPPLEGAIRIALYFAFDQLPFILHQSSFAHWYRYSIVETSTPWYHSLVSS